MYRIGYFNANSLPDGKFAQAISLLETSFDFLFIAEHWYQHHDKRLVHPLVQYSTIRPISFASPSNNCRQHGGIYLLATRQLQKIILSTTSTARSIVLSLPGLKFAGVYYPPYSLNESALKADFNQMGSVDILIGDINTRFSCNIIQRQTHSRVSPSTRSLHFQSWPAMHSMIHLLDKPSHKTVDNIPDHAFSKLALQPFVSLALIPNSKLNINTDHRYLLQLDIDTTTSPLDSAIPNRPDLPPPLRFRVQKLRQPEIAKKYCSAWSLIDEIDTSYKDSEIFDIDILDAELCSSIQAIAELELGTYDPSKERTTDDCTANNLAQEFDMTASIQLLKRSQRAAIALSPLISLSDSLPPMQDCINHYENIF
ncbi:hypothetical protein B9Z19DRAFT_1066770 [Tuber borchii]|uniref:Endonuclease/exonuclease/phosphatase n=1 Tax=Tuber borchii TaxID=42251 RepID=A0A2T6ZL99_TUBBO|nr:hypothetical protein B9Z19DRAFT_1066770 [Tuber borchii]